MTKNFIEDSNKTKGTAIGGFFWSQVQAIETDISENVKKLAETLCKVSKFVDKKITYQKIANQISYVVHANAKTSNKIAFSKLNRREIQCNWNAFSNDN